MSLIENLVTHREPRVAGGLWASSVEPVQAVRLSDLDAGALAAWDRLADRAAEPNPFFRPDFVRAAADAHGVDPLLLVATSGADWVLCLPVERGCRWRRLALRCLTPWMPDVSFLSVPLVDGSYVDGAAGALAGFVAADRRDAGLVLDPVDPDGTVGRALARAFADGGRDPLVYATWQRGALHRRSEPTYLEEAMSAKRRKELRRLRRALARELRGEVVAVDRSADPAAHEEFLAMEAGGWKGDAGTALASHPERAEFFRSMCQTAAAAGRLQILSLEAAGRTAAMQCNLIDGDALFAFKVAFDGELGRFSPGALLEADAIAVFHDSLPATWADSCAAPDGELVNRMWPDRRRMQTLVVPTGARRAALIVPNLAAEAIARRLVHRIRGLLGTRRVRARRP